MSSNPSQSSMHSSSSSTGLVRGRAVLTDNRCWCTCTRITSSLRPLRRISRPIPSCGCAGTGCRSSYSIMTSSSVASLSAFSSRSSPYATRASAGLGRHLLLFRRDFPRCPLPAGFFFPGDGDRFGDGDFFLGDLPLGDFLAGDGLFFFGLLLRPFLPAPTAGALSGG